MAKTKIIDEEKIKHKENLDHRKVQLTSIISFLMGFSQAVLAYVMSTYFKEATGMESVGPFYLAAYSISLLTLFNLHKLVKIFGRANIFYFSLLFKIITIVFLMIGDPNYAGAAILVIYMIFSSLEWASLDVIIESFSIDRLSGRIRGKHLTVLNAGFLLGPFVATQLLSGWRFYGVFLFLFIFNSIILIFSLPAFRDVNHRFKGTLRARDILKKITTRKNILRIYWISFMLELFYAVTVIYIPIYFLELGFSWEDIGLVLTIMLIPFVLIQYPIGILADKRFGEKEFLIASLLVMFLGTAGIFFLDSRNLLAWGMVLFFGRIGAAILEVMRDSYFYKRIDSEDVDLINFFRTSLSTGYIAAAALSFFVLLFFPLKTLFLFLAGIIFLGFWPAFRLVDNKCEREIDGIGKNLKKC